MLYFDTFNTAPLLYFNQIATTVGRLPEELARRVMRTADPEERARRLGGYILLERMVKRHTDDFKTTVEGIVKPEFGLMFEGRGVLPAVRYDSYGKPYFEGHDNAAFNISHSRHIAACVLNTAGIGETATPVGIDVQMISFSHFHTSLPAVHGIVGVARKEDHFRPFHIDDALEDTVPA